MLKVLEFIENIENFSEELRPLTPIPSQTEIEAEVGYLTLLPPLSDSN